VQLDGYDGNNEKPDNILNPQGQQDDFMR
jgi:hypothetical protein